MAISIEERKRRANERARKRRLENLEAARAKAREKYHKDPEAKRERGRKSYERNLEKRRERDRRRKTMARAARRDEINARQREYYRRNRAKRLANIYEGRLRRNPGRGLANLIRDLEAGRVEISAVSARLGERIALSHEFDSRYQGQRPYRPRKNSTSSSVCAGDRTVAQSEERSPESIERSLTE